MLAEEGSWKRIFGLDAQTLFDTAVVLVAMLFVFLILSYLLFNPARELINKRKELIAGEIVFSEPLTLLSGLGILLILSAVILLNRKQKERPAPQQAG